ncbi:MULTISPECIES: molybdopterin-containing oxidoreductase family protein [Rhizobium/Agrobacterium group]|uniref:molybdopterin-containing oxidoreductase family protein n=1 Tax=Rhizobium/Agrobacterium group TaxID=227290 RepID=UPI0004A2E181|nr:MULTISPECIES: molybdopterin oxidoreductase family protein [Rhizobium/Agrobacterium group]KQY54100.1 dehydrogenase [Rhizobium sp. Root491]MDR5008442.1 molybdopterin oxidoreductase family protein [Agrobacterium tumefaciens]NSY58193.1 molybdopterin oxidoreductase family protein [Agrobacterium tumefaciens]NTZ59668.1 molybdopterin oxidoreductase family protein [Agrobacterium tumefaciens]UXR90819.1 molybdopterin oxidoreductase family protein [Agrobacterium tumefaciens]
MNILDGRHFGLFAASLMQYRKDMNLATPISAKNAAPKAESATRIGHTVCPHDCPSACALEVDINADGRIGRVRGANANTYTAGVICAKVARYSERIYHPGRLLTPKRRKGAKGAGDWQEISWAAALDEVADALVKAEAKHGAEAVWPYFYAGTMGQVQRDSIERLRHAKKYSGFFGSICTNMAWTGYVMGTGALRGPDPREIGKADVVVIWGTNAVATQVNVMTHAVKARKERGAKIVVVDIYDNPTMKQADMRIVLRPGTDAALACAIMHIAFRDGYADRDYMARFADDPVGLEEHLKSKTPQWASEITGLSLEEIEDFARLVGTTKKTFFRLGYGFARQRNGAVAMHAALSIATVLGSWQYEGGGAFHNNGDIFRLNKAELMGTAYADPNVRQLDQSQIGRVLTGDAEALRHGGPVTALLIQNTNPVNVAPEQRLVKQGFLRYDLFVAVHEQFMTETAELADIVLPATMFLEHDDIYRAGGQNHILLGPKLVEPPETVRSNLFVIEELAKRLGIDHMPGFGLSARDHVDHMLKVSGWGDFDTLAEEKWIDAQPSFEVAHYLEGFGYGDGKFRFSPEWATGPSPNKPPKNIGVMGPVAQFPKFPDQVDVIETADGEHPFRLATSPARNFLNSTFAETKTSVQKEGRPEVMICSEDATRNGIADGDIVRIGNGRGEVRLHAKIVEGARPGVLVAEGLWPNKAHLDGEGINVLTGADAVAPYGGAAFHDNKVWLHRDDEA